NVPRADVVRDRKLSGAKLREDWLHVTRRVINLSTQANPVVLTQRLLECLAVRRVMDECEIFVIVGPALSRQWQRCDAGDVFQPLVINSRNAVACGDEFFQASKLCAADNGVRFAHPPVVAESRVEV